MSELIDRYLLNLESRLAKKLHNHEAEEHIGEIGAHLFESVATLQAEGDSNPEVTALKRVGPDRLLAENLIRARRGLDSVPGWRFVIPPALLLLAYGVLTGSFIIWERIPSAVEPLMTWLPISIVSLFFFGMIRSRRLLIVPTFAAFAVFLALFLGVEIVWGPSGFSDYSARKRVRTMEGLQTQISELQKDIETAQSVRSNSPFPQELRVKAAYLAPTTSSIQDVHLHFGLIAINQGVRQTSYLREVNTEAQAQSDWSKYGKAYLSYTTDRAKEEQTLLRVWSEREIGPKLYLSMLWRSSVSMTPLVAVIFGVGTILLGFAALRRRLIKALWNPERLAT